MSVHVRGHPIHTMLVVFPVGLYFFALVFDIFFLATGKTSWYTAAYYNLLFGLAMTVPTVLFGFFDYTLITDPAARQTATRHMLANVTATVLYGASFALRGTIGSAAEPIGGVPLAFAIALVALGTVALTIGGWLGGELVYRHRVGVGIEPANVHIPKPVADEAGNRANTFGDFPRARPA